MIRKFISLMILGSLMLTCFTGCGLELGQGMIKEFEDNKDGIRRELGELWNGFLDEFNDWTDSFATHSITKDSRLVGERKRVSMIMLEHMRLSMIGLPGRSSSLVVHRSNVKKEAI